VHATADAVAAAAAGAAAAVVAATSAAWGQPHNVGRDAPG